MDMKKKHLLGIGLVVVGLGFGAITGCAPTHSRDDAQVLGSGVGMIEIDGASYEEVFAMAREVLSEYRFGINRVDASRGVITTHPKRTTGLASLWDQEQSSLGQEIEDLANQQERTIRVVFERAQDAVAHDPVVRARVEVMVFRVHRPHWRVETESIRFSTHAQSRDVNGKIEAGEFREPIGQDIELARRVALEISQRFE